MEQHTLLLSQPQGLPTQNKEPTAAHMPLEELFTLAGLNDSVAEKYTRIYVCTCTFGRFSGRLESSLGLDSSYEREQALRASRWNSGV